MSSHTHGFGAFPNLLSKASLVCGVCLTVLALVNLFPAPYAAVFEWIGSFCIMQGVTYLSSPRKSVLLAFTAFLLGTGLDPILVGHQSFEAWIVANSLVLVFALAGMGTSVLITRFIQQRH